MDLQWWVHGVPRVGLSFYRKMAKLTYSCTCSSLALSGTH